MNSCMACGHGSTIKLEPHFQLSSRNGQLLTCHNAIRGEKRERKSLGVRQRVPSHSLLPAVPPAPVGPAAFACIQAAFWPLSHYIGRNLALLCSKGVIRFFNFPFKGKKGMRLAPQKMNISHNFITMGKSFFSHVALCSSALELGRAQRFPSPQAHPGPG